MRDITTNPEWERAYQYEIPVLAKMLSDGSEVGSIHCFVHSFILVIPITMSMYFDGFKLFGKECV